MLPNALDEGSGHSQRRIVRSPASRSCTKHGAGAGLGDWGRQWRTMGRTLIGCGHTTRQPHTSLATPAACCCCCCFCWAGLPFPTTCSVVFPRPAHPAYHPHTTSHPSHNLLLLPTLFCRLSISLFFDTTIILRCDSTYLHLSAGA
jgi:hypothetical protein